MRIGNREFSILAKDQIYFAWPCRAGTVGGGM